MRTHSSTVIWEIRDGTRHLVDPPAGADVTVIPRSVCRRFLSQRAGKTSVTVDAPVFVGEHQPFLIHARVRASGGDRPRGRCLFYQISRAGLKERANHATRAATCTAGPILGDQPRPVLDPLHRRPRLAPVKRRHALDPGAAGSVVG